MGAILGIFLVLLNKWGWFEIRIILTTAVIAGASVAGLACDLARTPRGKNLLVNLGLGLTMFGSVLLLYGIWIETHSETYWQTTISVIIFAVATVHVCLLSIARLAAKFRWVYLVACQVIFGLASLLCIMIFGEIDNERLIQFVGVLAIIDAALTMIIPLLHRISKADTTVQTELLSPLNERNIAAIDHELAQLHSRVAELEKLRTEITGESEPTAEN